MANSRQEEENEAVERFREYLKIPSVHPNINYEPCVEFILREANDLGLPVSVHYFSPKKPIVIITWHGNDLSLSSIMLNSHMDVVPVVREKWNYDPFGAEMDSEGNIYARGTQDMKSVGIQYLEAIRRLKKDGIVLKRTVHVTFVPDEEIGGIEGMRQFVHTSVFKQLNVGCALDEGRADPDNKFHVFYGERCNWKVSIHCTGPPGHGCMNVQGTSGEKMRVILDRFMEFRQNEMSKIPDTGLLRNGGLTTANLTLIKGGIQENIIPHEIVVTFDIRVAVNVDHEEFENTINGWCKEAGNGVFAKIRKEPQTSLSSIDPDDPWWGAFNSACDILNVEAEPEVCQGNTDIRFVREMDIPAYGFSPLTNTPILLHQDDEYVNKNTFLRGIEVYYQIIQSLANVPE